MSQNQNTDLVQFDPLVAELEKVAKPALGLTVVDQASSENVIAYGRNLNAMKKRIEAKRDELVRPLNNRVKEINDYAKRISAPIDTGLTHLRTEAGAYEAKCRKIREEAERKAAEELRQKEAEAARLAAEEKKKEEARLKKEREAEEAKIKAAKLAAEKEAKAAAIFSGKEEADRIRREAAEKAEQDRKDREEREKQARLDLEAKNAEREQLANQEYREKVATANQAGVSGASAPWVHRVTEAGKVPREFCVPCDKLIRAGIKAGLREIPGCEITQDTRIAFR
jgi:hypothetical protein